MEYQLNMNTSPKSNMASPRPIPPYRRARRTPPSSPASFNIDEISFEDPNDVSEEHSILPPAYRRAVSLPPELESTTPRPPRILPTLGRRRNSVCFRQRVSIEYIEEKIYDTRILLADIDVVMKKLEEKRIAMEAILDRAERQLDDHTVYFDGRYPPAPDRFVDVTEKRLHAQEQWSELRLVNASVRSLKDDITPLPYADGRMPKHFPTRLAGLMNLTERQVDGLLFGYGHNPNDKESFVATKGLSLLDAKRRFLASFIGVDIDEVLSLAALANIKALKRAVPSAFARVPPPPYQ